MLQKCESAYHIRCKMANVNGIQRKKALVETKEIDIRKGISLKDVQRN